MSDTKCIKCGEHEQYISPDGRAHSLCPDCACGNLNHALATVAVVDMFSHVTGYKSKNSVEHFWPTSCVTCQQIQAFIDGDIELQDIEIEDE